MRNTAHPVPEFFADQSTPHIECAPAVLETVRAASVDGLMRLGRGGIEVGGLLFGKRTADTLHILAARPFECEHRFGPNFVLSEQDEAVLREFIDPAHRDSETRDLDAVGWYMSHCRRGYSLAESDIRVFDRYFPNPGSVTLIVMPEKLGPARAGFFVRDANGAVRAEAPSSEISVTPTAERAPLVPAPDTVRALQRSAAVVDEAPDNREVALERLQTYLKRQEKHRRISRWNLWATLALLFVCIGGAVYLWIKWHAPETQAAIPLHVSGSGTEIRIEWDSKLDSVQKASAGLLEMRESDGASVRVNVPRDALRIGSAIYNRHSDKVEVRLRLLYPDRPAFDSVVYFINPLSVAAAKPVDVPPAVVEKVEPPAPTKETNDRQAKTPSPRRFEPPKMARTAPQQSVELPSAPLPTDIGSANPAPALKLPIAAAPAPPPPPAPVTQPVQPVRRHSGRLIWTGEFARNGLLTLSSTGASAGWMNGHLPGFPVKVSVYPGDLVTGGIEVYVSDPKHSTTAESPSAQNGWNTVVFKYDPKRIPDIRILQPPSAANSWNQLVLQNGKRALSVLVIDWTENR